MKKKIIVHVGPPKTGTSMLQFWLNKNAGLLSKHGIFYPKHEVDVNNVSSGHRSLFLERRPDTTRTQFNHSKFSNRLEKFEKKDCNILLLSSEFFFYQIPEFIKYTDSYDIQFIAYVRPDFELIESLYNQSVKRNGQTLPLAPRSSLRRSYLDELIKYVSEYSSAPFLLRAYGNENVFEDNIITDFLSALRINAHTLKTKLPAKVNSSYSFECLEFKRWVNKFNLGKLDQKVDNCLQGYKASSNAYTLLPAYIYQSYKEQSLEKIRALHALAPIHNYERLVEYVATKPRAGYIHQELYPKHLVRVGSHILLHDPDLLKKLIEHIQNQDITELDNQRLKILLTILDDCPNSEMNRTLFDKVFSWIRK